MKKLKLLVVLLLVLGLIGCQYKHVTTSLESLNLKGKVKTIESTYYQLEDGKEVKQFVAVDEFNEKGYLKKSTVYDALGEEVDRAKYTYSTKGTLIKVTHTNFEMNGYDTLRIRYNRDNLPTVQTYYDAKARTVQKVEKAYDEEERLANEIYFDGSNKATNLTLYDYNESGILRTILHNDLRTEEVLALEVTLDERGNRILEKSTDEENDIAYKRTFDAYDNLTSERTLMQGGIAYDLGYGYEYDAKNNWIVQKELNGGVHVKTIKRKFEYYEE